LVAVDHLVVLCEGCRGRRVGGVRRPPDRSGGTNRGESTWHVV